MKPRLRVMRLLNVSKVPLSGAAISVILGVSSGRLYPILAALETEQTICSEWDEGSDPRRRLYRAIPDGPSIIDENRHLAGQVSALLAELELERAKLHVPLQEFRAVQTACEEARAERDVYKAKWEAAAAAAVRRQGVIDAANARFVKTPEYDELTDELMAVTHGLLRIIGGREPAETVARAVRAHAFLLRLHSVAFPVPVREGRPDAKA